MKLSIICMIMFILLGCQQSSGQPIEINSNFDHGSMGVLKQVNPRVFQGQTNHFIKKNKNGNQYYWFYFQILNAKDKSITIKLNHMVGIYRGNPHLIYTDYTQPVLSPDKKNWRRITDINYNAQKKEFTFNFTPSADTAWVAYAQPYPYSRLKHMSDTLRNSEYISIKKLGKSVDGRPINMIRISENDNTNKKKNVFLTGMQHAGEDEAGFFIEGLIQFLLSKDKRAISLLKKCNFYIIPMMNPDGFFYGTSRYNWNMADLNSNWDNGTDTADTTTEPEVMEVKKWVKNFARKNSIDLFLDIHNHGQQGTANHLRYLQKSFRKFAELNSKIWDVKAIKRKRFKGSVTWYMSKKYDVPSGTMELTQSHTGSGNYLTIQDYYDYGAGLGKAIDQYFP